MRSICIFGMKRGSVVAVTDGNANKLAINSYDEYGIPASIANPDGTFTNLNTGRFQYTGQAWLDPVGLYNYKARMYSPTLGRFLQTDPIGYADGMNWYNYVGSDPVNRTDPSGNNATCNSDGASPGCPLIQELPPHRVGTALRRRQLCDNLFDDQHLVQPSWIFRYCWRRSSGGRGEAAE